MTPQGWASALAFLLFVAPGIVFELLSRRRRAGVEESTFQEVSRVALSSVAFSLPAFALVAWLGSRIQSVTTVARRAEAGELSFVSTDGLVLLVLALAQLALACFFAAGAHSVLQTVSPGSNIALKSGWTIAIRDDCPDDHEVYARVKMTSGSVWTGRVANFTAGFEPDHRELVLMPPLTSAPPRAAPKPLPTGYQRVALAGPEIVSVAFQYRLPRSEPDAVAVRSEARTRGARGRAGAKRRDWQSTPG